MHVEFNGTIRPDATRGAMTGRWSITTNGTWLSTVPFMRNGISTNFLQHGCTGQGEPGFPQLKSYVSTWGYCDVRLNGRMLYEGVWLHTMYSNRMREAGTNTIWADRAHSRAYDPKQCWTGGDVRDDLTEFSFIVARWCKSPNPHQVHALTDVNIVMSFLVVDDISPAVQVDAVAR